MIALYIIFGITLLIGLILVLRVRLVINFDDDLCVYLRFLFFTYRIYPEKPKKAKSKRRKSKKSKNTKAEASTKSEEPKKEDTVVSKLWAIRKVLLTTIEKFLGKVHFKFVKLNAVVGCENAAATALLYGAVSQGVAYLIEVLDNISNVDISKRSEISVKSDFVSQKSSLDGKIVLYISVVHLLYVLAEFLKKMLKSKMKIGE